MYYDSDVETAVQVDQWLRETVYYPEWERRARYQRELAQERAARRAGRPAGRPWPVRRAARALASALMAAGTRLSTWSLAGGTNE